MTPSNSQNVSLQDAPQKILVADDELLVAQGIIGLLKTLGFEIIGPCKNGEEAIALVREDKPDMALLDIQMPIMDGYQATGEIRKQDHQDLIICGLSANAMKEDFFKAKKAGMNDYMTKPLKLKSLEALISKHLPKA